MAHDHHDHRQGASSSTGKHHHKKRRTAPLPPVPAAQPNLLQAAPPNHPAASTTSSASYHPADAAKRGLEEWGAFTGGGAGGFGPLLFRHAGVDDAGSAAASADSAQPRQLTGRDLVEMDRLRRTDPVSFNPLQAISWARLEEDVHGEDDEEENAVPVKGKGKGRAGGSSSGGGGGGKSRGHSGVGREEYTANHQHHHRGGHHQQRTIEPSSPSPVGNMAKTFSDMGMASAYLPPSINTTTATTAVISPSSSSSIAPAAPGRQQRKHRHRHDKNHSGNDIGYQQQQQTQPQMQDYQSSFPASASASYPAQSQYHHQQAATSYTTATHYATTAGPHHHQQHLNPNGLLLCLAPSCQARFASEAQLASHYQSAHGNGQQKHAVLYNNHNNTPSSSSSLMVDTSGYNQHACSWTACGATGFTSNNALMWHVKAEHLLLCPVPGCCDRVFTSRKQLDSHVRNKAG